MKQTLSVDFDQVKNLFHYFGYEMSVPGVGVWAFRHKSMRENTCVFTAFAHPTQQKIKSPWIAKLEFFGIIDGKSKRTNLAKVKAWNGVFITLRNHTRREIMIRNLQKQAA